jgi:hypothetical protein
MSGLWSSVCVALMVVVQPSTPGMPIAECRLPEDADGRIFQLVDRGSDRDPRWWLTLRSRALAARLIELPLPAAKVRREAARITVSSTSANGGLAIDLVAAAAGATLDVFVNFELEVNVWRDLSPEVERMNTGGPRRDARCVILSRGSGLP